MSSGWTTLQLANIADVERVYGLYGLLHAPSAKAYYGSTLNMHERIRLWYYAIQRPATKIKLPRAIKETLKLYGYRTEDWCFFAQPRSKPADYNPHARMWDRPEWPVVLDAYEKDPQRVLNDIRPLRARGIARPERDTREGGLGVSPYAYLGRMIGELKPRLPRNTSVTHHWPWSFQACEPFGSPHVPFALFLFRAMQNGVNKKSTNPTPSRLTEVYEKWLEHTPTDYYRTHVKIEAVQEALAVPTPPGYGRLKQQFAFHGLPGAAERAAALVATPAPVGVPINPPVTIGTTPPNAPAFVPPPSAPASLPAAVPPAAPPDALAAQYPSLSPESRRELAELLATAPAEGASEEDDTRLLPPE